MYYYYYYCHYYQNHYGTSTTTITMATTNTTIKSLNHYNAIYLDNVTKHGVQLAVSEALEYKVNPAIHTSDVFTRILQLCYHFPHLQHSLHS